MIKISSPARNFAIKSCCPALLSVKKACAAMLTVACEAMLTVDCEAMLTVDCEAMLTVELLTMFS